MPEKVDDLPQFLGRLVDARHIRKGDLHIVIGVDLRAAPTEGERSLARAETGRGARPEEEQEGQRQQPGEKRTPPVRGEFSRDLHTVLVQFSHQRRVLDANHGDRLIGFLERAADVRRGDHDGLHLIAPHHLLELGVPDRTRVSTRERAEDAERDHHRKPVTPAHLRALAGGPSASKVVA